MLAEVFLPLDPVFRFLVSMCDGKYPDGRGDLHVRDVVSENLKIDSAIPAGSNPWNSRISGDPTDVAVHFVSEAATKSCLLCFILGHGIVEFSRCLR